MVDGNDSDKKGVYALGNLRTLLVALIVGGLLIALLPNLGQIDAGGVKTVRFLAGGAYGGAALLASFLSGQKEEGRTTYHKLTPFLFFMSLILFAMAIWPAEE